MMIYYILTALPIRPPTIVVLSRHLSSIDGCGQVKTLGCTPNQVENLFTQPTIVWIAPDGLGVSTEAGNNLRVDPTTRHLIFSDSILDDIGIYTCHTVLNIPKAQIVNHIEEATIMVTLNGE